MRRGFIYSIGKVPFSYPETNATKEFIQIMREAGEEIILSDRERFIYQMGYEFGLIDG